MERLTPPHSPQIEDLLGVFALDALDPDEAAMVEAHLATCPRCRQEVASHREVAGKLGSLGQEAPPLVWDRIAANLSPAPPRSAPILPLSRARLSRKDRSPLGRSRLLGGLSGLVAAVVILVLGIAVLQLNHRVNGLRNAQAPNMASVGAAIAAPGSQQVALTSLNGGPALAEVVIDSDGVGYVYNDLMPTLAADRTYELWGIVNGTRVPFGLLGANPAHITEFVVKGRPVALAVTNERAGGVLTSTKTPLALADLAPV